MLLRDIMSKKVEVISPDTNLRDASRKMKELDVGFLPICDGDKLRGAVTDRDIVVRGIAEGLDAESKVTDVKTKHVIYAFEDQDVKEAARLMEEKQIRRLIVLDKDKRLCGVVSLGDLSVQTGDEKLSGQALEGISDSYGEHAEKGEKADQAS